MSATHYEIGDVVECVTTAQGMQKGHRYTIRDKHVQDFGVLGRFVHYEVEGSGRKMWVANLHLLACLVEWKGARS